MRNFLLELFERGPFGGAVGTPGGPEIEDHGFASILIEAYGLGSVVNGEVGRGLADLVGIASAIAACGSKGEAEKQGCEFENGSGAHILIIRDSECVF